MSCGVGRAGQQLKSQLLLAVANWPRGWLFWAGAHCGAGMPAIRGVFVARCLAYAWQFSLLPGGRTVRDGFTDGVSC